MDGSGSAVSAQYPVSALIGEGPALIPVLSVADSAHAEPLLAALVEAGIRMIEVTLRTDSALDVIARMARAGGPAVIGAGTITRPEQFAPVVDAGARFGVGPAFTPRLADAARKSGLRFVPGVATTSEALAARDEGLNELKFFPAELAGGLAWIKHIEPVLPDVRFCPTAGINGDNAASFLARPNIFAVGGAFLAPREMIEAADWDGITANARRAVEKVAGGAVSR
jgi:2-dehydro-3-deoxyphosphogluconate aldolase/(4S)-4-hydroxy-2-oxoglutarate aldolase